MEELNKSDSLTEEFPDWPYGYSCFNGLIIDWYLLCNCILLELFNLFGICNYTGDFIHVFIVGI